MLRIRNIALIALVAALFTGAVGAQVYINEYCNDPSGPPAIDPNLDGNFSTTDDEFIEIVNAGPGTVDIGGWQLWDGFGQRHVFATGTMLPAGGAIVVFGGGDVTNFNAMGWATGVTASTGAVGLNNSNDSITLFDAALVQIDTQAYGSGTAFGDGDGESITRATDLPGDLFVAHTTVPSGLAHSAGTKNDGVTPWLPAIVAPPIPPTYPGNGTDFVMNISVNGSSLNDPTGVHAGLAVFDWVNIWFTSPGGTTELQPFSAFYQIYGAGASLSVKSIPGDPTGTGWWLDDGVSPPNPGGLTPTVVFIDGLQLLIGGQVIPPVLPQTFGFNYSFQIPPVLSGLDLHLQALIIEPGLNSWNLGISNGVVLKTN